MKITSIILTLFITTGLFAQNPEDSLLKSLKQQFGLSKHDRLSERILFNQDTIVFAGYLGNPSSSSLKNVVYKTSNGGKNWRVIEFDGNAWIYDSYHDQDGRIWMGGSDHFIHYSKDFGETWTRKIVPFDPVDRIMSIFMVDPNYGVAGGLSNGLAITHDNWKSSIQIDSPIDQKKFQILKQSARDRIDNIAIIDSLIVINQNDYIFYSKVSDIQWKKFNIPVYEFQVDEMNKEITLESRNGKHFVVGSDLILKRTFQKEEEETLWKPFKDDTTKLDLTEFLKTPIHSIKIISKKYEFAERMHMIATYKENIQEADISFRNNIAYFNSKDYEKKTLDLKKEDLVFLLSNNLQVQLSELSNHLNFTKVDFENYKLVLRQEQDDRKEQEKWGGNFTSQLSLENPLFKNYEKVTTKINQSSLEAVINEGYFPLSLNRQNNSIKVIFVNEKKEELILSNKYSIHFSLPWSISYGETSITSYNPKLTKFIKSILPNDFNNYNMLFGGQLIYDLIEEKIIDEIEYENGY